MKTLLLLCLPLALAFFVPVGFGQQTPAIPLEVKVSAITENRGAGVSACRIQLQFSGAGVGTEYTFLGAKVLRAEDSTGKDLLLDTTADLARPRSDPGEGVWVRLDASTRSAEFISLIEGEVRLQRVDNAAEALVALSDLAAVAGEFYKLESLDQRRIRLGYLDRATYDEKGIELVKANLRARLRNATGISDQQLNDSAVGLKAIFNSANMVVLVVGDPDENIVSLRLEDESGTETIPFTSSTAGLAIAMNSKLADPKVRIQFKSDGEEIVVPFTLRDIKLP